MKKHISIENVISYIALGIFSLFAINPIIQAVYHFCGGAVWFPFREFIALPPLFIGAALFFYYLAYRKWFLNRPVGIFKLQARQPALLMFAAFAVLMTVSTFVNAYGAIMRSGLNTVALIGTEYRNEGLLTYLSYLMFFLFAAFVTDEKIKMLWLKIYAAVTTVPAVILIIDNIIPGYPLGTNERLTLFNNDNHLGYYLVISAMVAAVLMIKCAGLRDKLIFGSLYGVNCFALLINNTLGCILALMIGTGFAVLVLSLCEKKIYFAEFLPMIIFVGVFVFGFAVMPKIRDNVIGNMTGFGDIGTFLSMFFAGDGEDVPDDAGSGRMKLWKSAVSYIREKPWLGYSADGMGYRMTYDAGNDRCHCEFMNYALSFGIPAMMFYIAGVLLVFIRGLIHRKELTDTNKTALCAAFCYLVSSCVGNTMFYTAPLFFIMLGLGYYRENRADENTVGVAFRGIHNTT